MKLLDQYRQKVYVSPRVVQLALGYLTQGYDCYANVVYIVIQIELYMCFYDR